VTAGDASCSCVLFCASRRQPLNPQPTIHLAPWTAARGSRGASASACTSAAAAWRRLAATCSSERLSRSRASLICCSSTSKCVPPSPPASASALPAHPKANAGVAPVLGLLPAGGSRRRCVRFAADEALASPDSLACLDCREEGMGTDGAVWEGPRAMLG
jgi:hypothetical protein